MKTWRMIIGMAAATGLLIACSEDPKKKNEDDGGGGSGAASTTTTTTTTATTTTTTTTTTTSTGTTGCTGEADFLACANCFCAEDQAGCGAFLDLQDEHFYCGQTCETDCTAYCATVDGGMPDANAIDATCDTCVDGIAMGNPDITNFQTDCSADAACTGFLSKLQTCPQN